MNDRPRGRDVEIATVSELLAVAPSSPRLIILYGAAGIGKTELWRWLLDECLPAPSRCWRARGTQSELVLPWVTLTDLLRDEPNIALEAMPAPQRAALETATLRGAAVDIPDERVVGTALATLVQSIVDREHLVLALDDAPWIDPFSARAVRFALRRARGPVTVLATARVDGDDIPIIDLIPDAPSTRLRLGPLGADAIGAVLRRHLPRSLPAPIVAQVNAATLGNPMLAVELGRAILQGEVVPRPGAPLVLPGGLHSMVAHRVAQLGRPARLAVAAAAATPHLRLVDVDPDAVEEAMRAGLLDVERGVVRPAHPLIGAAAYGDLNTVARAALHRHLATVVTDSADRARHLALASDDPDEAVAESLDSGSLIVESRGGTAAALDFAELAVARTPEGSAALVSRWARLADLRFRSGDTSGALDAYRRAVDATVGAVRARQRVRLAEVLVESGGLRAGLDELERALHDAAADTLARAEVHLTMAAILYEDLDASIANARCATELLGELDDPPPHLLAGAMTQLASARFRAGLGLDHVAFRHAIELERAAPSRRLSDRADAGYAALVKYADGLDEAERLLQDLLVEAEASHDLSSIAYVRAHMTQIPLWRGDIAEAQRCALAHLAVADDGDMADQRQQAMYLLGLVSAHAGDVVEADRLLSVGLSTREPWLHQRSHGGLGFLRLSTGDLPGALQHLRSWWRLSGEIGLREPGQSRFHVDYAIALVDSGELADADDFAKQLDDQAGLSGRRSAIAAVALTRAMVAAARGESDDALLHAGEALAVHESLELHFERARACLIAGRIYRRAKLKRAAHDRIREALTAFESFGTPLWAVIARRELARVGLRPPAPTTLTPSERSVAELAAQGMTNRQVADALFVAPKTVEANLSRVYRKLGIASRAELGAWFVNDA